jgi:hypothetical protein
MASRNALCVSLVLALLAIPALAQAQLTVTFGDSWDGASNRLQAILDANYGAGAINAATDYIGHDAGEPDPFAWQDEKFDALIVREVAGNANRNLVGWYKETGVMPVIDGIDDGVVFNGPDAPGTFRYVVFPGLVKFGFWMNPNGTQGATNAPEPEKFFTNRRLNDAGPDGAGALHAPFGGDAQALVYDLSAYYHKTNVWLVCFEDLDAGANPAACCSTDNDYNDFVFEVHALGTTDSRPVSLGSIKALYRR